MQQLCCDTRAGNVTPLAGKNLTLQSGTTRGRIPTEFCVSWSVPMVVAEAWDSCFVAGCPEEARVGV